jgi:hypothetical protein
MATVQLVGERIAPRVVVVFAAMADMGLIQLRRTQLHPTPHQEAAEVVAEGLVAPRSRAGREQVRLLSTRLPKCGHSRRLEKA